MKKRYINLITENNEIAFNIFLGHLAMQAAIMESQGYNRADRRRYLVKACVSLHNNNLNEGLLDSLGSAAAWLSNKGFLQHFQEMLASKIAGPLADLLGIPKEGILYKIFVNVIENMDFTTVTAVISGNGCEPLANKIAGAIQESIVETIFQEMNLGQSGFGAMVRESIQHAFVEGGPVAKFIATEICKFNFEDILAGAKENFIGKAPNAPAAA